MPLRLRLRPRLVLALVVLLALLGGLLAIAPLRAPSDLPDTEVYGGLTSEPLTEPGDWLNTQRAFPDESVPVDAFERAVEQASVLDARAAEEEPALAGADWEQRGPTNIGGRVMGLAVDPTEDDTVYAGSASGGVWKSIDAGATWEPAWPEDLTQAIGDLVITPEGTLYAGTGETGPGGGSITFGGSGVYRSTDQGESWEQVGLEDSSRIGRIMIDPTDSQRIFVAASGPLFNPGGQRGVYRTTDGGGTWEQVLAGANGNTGAADLAIDPSNPDRIFATMWDHQRAPELRTYGGEGSGLYRSEDGGDTWELVEGVPGNDPEVGRIGVAVAPSNPDIVYASVVGADGRFDSFHQSPDGGDTWTTIPADATPVLDTSQSSFGWWFGRIFVDPLLPDHLFIPGVFLLESYDGGLSYGADVAVHADQHIMAWDPKQTGRVYLGNDGGVYRSDENGAVATYVQFTSLANNQIYTLDVSEEDPSRLVIGLQDQGSNRNWEGDGSGTVDQWSGYVGGDGLKTLINPDNQDVIYGCSQYGNCSRSENGGESTARIGATTSDRRNWLTPLVFDPVDPEVMYYAGNILNRSTDGGRSWEPISPDLTKGEAPDPDYPFGTITTVGPSASDPERLYVGTDDGLVWTTTDLGENWTRLTDDDLPEIYVTSVTPDPDDADTVYATFSGFRSGDDTARVARSTDGGATWDNISADLPDAPVNDLLLIDGDLTVATDVGVFLSRDGGLTWLGVGDGLPLAPIMDIRYHEPTRVLAAGSFGRSVYSVEVPEAPDTPEEPGGPGGPDGDPDATPPPRPRPTDPSPAPSETPTERPTEPEPGPRQVNRVFAADRFGTAAQLSASTFEPGVEVAYVATGGDFPDALTGAPAATADGAPVLLVTDDDVPDVTAEELRRLEPGRIVVLGGSDAVGDSVVEDLRALTDGSVDRLAGPDRFGTAAAIAADTFPSGAETVYIATGSDFPDALTGSAAAADEGAPVLLVGRDSVPAATGEALDRLRPGRLVVLGGPNAVDPTVVAALEERTGADAQRLFGADRYGTAAEVAATYPAPSAAAYVATGTDFPDALTAAPVAGARGAPILLVEPDALPAVTADALERLQPAEVIVVGGPNAVSQAVADQLEE